MRRQAVFRLYVVVVVLAACNGGAPGTVVPAPGDVSLPGADLAAQLDAYLKDKDSPLSGYGADFVASGQKHNVDPRLIVAIAGEESSFGTKVCAEYNAWNWFYQNPNTCADNSFASWAEGIESVTRGIGGKSYLEGGRTTIEAIAEIYTGTERDVWIRNVTLFYHDELGGDLNDLTFKESDLSANATNGEGTPATVVGVASEGVGGEAPPASADGEVLGAATTASNVSGIDGFGIGSSAHLRVGKNGLITALDAQKTMGVRWIREAVPWEEVEYPQGVFRWQYGFDTPDRSKDISRDFQLLVDEAAKRQLRVIMLLSYGSPYHASSPDELVEGWKAYVSAVVAKFGDRVDYWEIGNEENSRLFWGKVIYPGQDQPAEPDPALYARLLIAAHDIIKASNPNDVLILGGLAGYVSDLSDCATNYFDYLRRLNDQPGAWEAFDVIAVHPYRDQGNEPEAVIDRGLNCQTNTPAQYKLVEEVQALHEFAQAYGAKPIWITEIGWHLDKLRERATQRSTANNTTTAANVEADYLVRTYVSLLAEAGVEKVFWYSQYDAFDDRNWELDAEGQKAIQVTSSLLTGAKPLGQVRGQNDRGGTDDDVYEYHFSQGNRTIIALWKARGGDEPHKVTVANLPDGNVFQIDSRDVTLTGKSLAPSGGGVEIDLTEHPIFLVIDPLTTKPLPTGNWWDQFVTWLTQLIQSWIQGVIDWATRELTRLLQEAWNAFINWLITLLVQAWNEFWKNLCGVSAIGPLLIGGWVWRFSRKQRRW